MARLTWQEMSAPDLGTSLQGYRQFSDLFNSAIAGAKSTVNEIDAGMTQRANEGALRLAAAVQDPEQAKQLLASDAIMANTRLNAPTIAQLAMRPAQLTAQQANELAFSDAKRASDQGIAQDELAPLRDRAYQLRAAEGANPNGLNPAQRAELQSLEAQITAAASKVGSKNSLANLTALSGAESDGLGRASTRLGMDSTRLGMRNIEQQMKFAAQEQGWKASDRLDLANASNAVKDAFEHGTDANSVREILKKYNLSGKAYGLAIGQLGSQFKGLVGDATFTSDGLGAGAIQDYSNIPFASVRPALLGSEGPGHLGGYDALAYNTPGGGNDAGVKPPKPVSQMTLGELYDFQTGPMRAKTRGRRGAKDVGSTGAGAYQFESQTMRDTAIRLWGNNWRNMKFSGQNQDAMAENLYNRVRGNAAALGNTWNVFRGNGLSGAAAAAREEIAGRRSQNSVTSIQRSWAESRNDRRSPDEVTDELLKTPNFKGVNRTYVYNQILDGMAAVPNSNAAQIAGILKASPGKSDEGFWGFGWARSAIDRVLPDRLKTPWAPNLGGGRRLDYTKRDAGFDEVRGGSVIDNVLQDKLLEDKVTAIDQAEKAYNAADAAYRAALNSPDTRARSRLPDLAAARDRAQSVLGIALASHTSDPNSQFQSTRQEVGKSTGGPSVGRRIFNTLASDFLGDASAWATGR